MPAYLFGGYMSEKSVRLHLSQRQAAADCINQALEKSDIAEICHAIGAATHLHNMSDIAKKSGIERPSLYRAFSGGVCTGNPVRVDDVTESPKLAE